LPPESAVARCVAVPDVVAGCIAVIVIRPPPASVLTAHIAYALAQLEVRRRGRDIAHGHRRCRRGHDAAQRDTGDQTDRKSFHRHLRMVAASPSLYRDSTYRIDVAAAGKVYRQYRGRRSWFFRFASHSGARARYRRAVVGRRDIAPAVALACRSPSCIAPANVRYASHQAAFTSGVNAEPRPCSSVQSRAAPTGP